MILYYCSNFLRGELMAETKRENELSALSDSSLTELVRQGSDSAFEEIARRYKGLIASLSAEYCTGDYDPCDFSQEGMLALLSACKTYINDENGASFKNYAALCVKRRFISIVRKSKAKGAIPEEHLVPLESAELQSSFQSPEELVVSKERLEELLMQMKNNLSQKEISVVYLYLKGLSYGEISNAAGISKKSVDNALQRIKRKLRE